MSEANILTVEGLSVTLDGIQVLRDVSFTMKQGEALAVIGPNGAGKTALFRALLGLLPHEGTVLWRPDTRIEYVPQRFSMERSTPITALEFCLLKSPGFWRPSAVFLRQVDHEIALMGLDRSVLKKNLGALSGGQTQRLLIAWALLQRPAVLLLDEPTAGVDASFEDTIYSLIRRVQAERGTTVLLVSHDLSVVYRYAQNVLCLNVTVICKGPPLEVLDPKELAVLFGGAGYYRHDPNVRH
jgi:ABC-type Mn2+/Zn2+ transport system ATPase subunit